MRVTNQMMTNTTLANINKNKLSMSKLENQYSTQKKIQRPSDDPIVAVRALKLRKNLDELNQYYERNVPDAMSWMDKTEGALTNINDILTKIYSDVNQGANGTLTASDRSSIIKNITELTKQIYTEGNTNYTGRYVFSGLKTDTSLIFETDVSDLSYTIAESFHGKDMISDTIVKGSYLTEELIGGTYDVAPTAEEINRIRLSYNKLDMPKDATLEVKITDKDGVERTIQAKAMSSTGADGDPYAFDENDPDDLIHFIPETGELILRNDFATGTVKTAQSVDVSYTKSSFEKGDLRPEHYFDTTKRELDSDGNVIKSTDYSNIGKDQSITYEVNFNQTLTVNTLGRDVITHNMNRMIQELSAAAYDVDAVEARIKEVKSELGRDGISDSEKEDLQALQEQLELELALKEKVLTEKFGSALTTTTNMQTTISVATADLGSRYTRLELIESRLEAQQTEFEDLLSRNEDADLVETVVRYNSQEVVFNASLNAASKIVKNTLLDFI